MSARLLVVQQVSDVPRATRSLLETSPRAGVEALAGGRVEACSQLHGGVVETPGGLHALVAAVHLAFVGHRPLVLSPDMLWLAIVQGVARHLNRTPGPLRRALRALCGRRPVLLSVARHDFCKGSPENPWAEVIDELTGRIRAAIGPRRHDALVVGFSTTGLVERAANQVALMDAVRSRFSDQVRSRCGIPEVRLEGTTADWRRLHHIAGHLLGRHRLGGWLDALRPTLGRIAANASGADDGALWRDLYAVQSIDGGDQISGWLLDLFPFLEQDGIAVRNPALGRPRGGSSVRLANLPAGLSRVPFRWALENGARDYELLAGSAA